MKAIVYSAPLTLELKEVDPPLAREGEVIVKVEAVGICGSELEGFASQSPFRVPPLVMGHEFAGIRTGDGRPVVVNPLISCGVCDSCLRGAANVCRNRVIVGIQRDGGFAEYVAVPAENCHELPADVPLRNAALVEPLANAVHALRLARTHTRDIRRVGVIGSGMVGVAVTVVTKALGVEYVAVSDLSPERLALAAGAGADAVGPELEGEFDVVFDAVGLGATRATAVRAIRPDGAVVFLGLHAADAGFDGRELIRDEKRVIGSFCYTDDDFAVAVGLVREVRAEWFDVRPLEQGVEAFTSLLDAVPATIKTVLVPAGGAA